MVYLHHWYCRRDLSFMSLFLGHVTWRRPFLLPTRQLGSHWRQRRLQIPHWTRVTPTQAAAGWTAHQQQPLLIPFLWVTVSVKMQHTFSCVTSLQKWKKRKFENHLLLVEGITKSLEPAASPLGRSESCFRLFLFYVRVCSLFGGFGFVLCLCVSFFGGFVERQLCSKSLGRSDSCGSL